MREAEIEGITSLDLDDILRSQLEAEDFDVVLQMGGFAAADDGKEVWGLDEHGCQCGSVRAGLFEDKIGRGIWGPCHLVQGVGKGDAGNGYAMALCNGVQDFGDALLAAKVHVRGVATSFLWLGARRLEVIYTMSAYCSLRSIVRLGSTYHYLGCPKPE